MPAKRNEFSPPMKKILLSCIIIALLIVLGLLFMFKKERAEQTQRFDYFLNETSLISNLESNNHIEGTPIVVVHRNGNRIRLSAMPTKIKDGQKNQWLLGWGAGMPYNNRGVENIRNCQFAGSTEITLGELIKGSGYPTLGDTLVFWNAKPSGYEIVENDLIATSMWKGFAGNSIHFANVVFDSEQNLFYIFANECDTSKIDIYSAVSTNLRQWSPVNNGYPILRTSDFEKVTWCGWNEQGTIRQSPFVSDIFFWNNKWYLLLYGFDKNGVRNIGYATAKKLSDKFQIAKTPILTPKKAGKWAEQGVFYPKISCFNDTIYLSFTGINNKNVEHLGLAKGSDIYQLIPLKNEPIIYTGSGWRNSDLSSESARIEVKKDSIFILLAGKKKWNDNIVQRRIFKTSYLEEKGNVHISQLGVFLSTDGGKTFIGHTNNPVLINHYATTTLNNHSGGNLARIETDSMSYLIQQEKATLPNSRYLITLKAKRINNL
jgi:hypothetical protein